jgi:hypothetical protein
MIPDRFSFGFSHAGGVSTEAYAVAAGLIGSSRLVHTDGWAILVDYPLRRDFN